MLQRISKPVGKARRVAEQRVKPLQPVLLVDRILGRGGGLTKQIENDGIGWRSRLRISRLFARGLTRGKRELTRHRPTLETDLVHRLREQSVGRRTHEEAQVIDRGEVTERIARRRIELHDDVVDNAIQPLDLIPAALSQKRRHRFAHGRHPRRHGQVIPFSEALADERTERLFGVADIDHSQVRPHNRHQHPVPDMPEKIVPEIFVHADALPLLIAAGASVFGCPDSSIAADHHNRPLHSWADTLCRFFTTRWTTSRVARYLYSRARDPVHYLLLSQVQRSG